MGYHVDKRSACGRFRIAASAAAGWGTGGPALQNVGMAYDYCNYEQAVCDAAFGWDSCDKGGWYRVLKDKVPDMKVRGVSGV